MNLLYTLFAALAVIFTFFTHANGYTSGVSYAYDRHSRKSKRVDNSSSNSTYASAWTSDTPACFDGYTSCEFFGCIKGTKCPAICSQRTTINTCYFSANGKGCRWEENKCIQDIQCPIDDSGKCPDGCQGCGPYQCVVKGLTCPAPCDGRTQDSCSSETIVNGIGCSWTAGKCVLWDVFNLIPLATDQVQAKEYVFELSDNSSSSSVSGSSDQTDTASSDQTDTASSNQTDTASSNQTDTASSDQTDTASSDQTDSASSDQTDTASSDQADSASTDQTNTASSSTDVSEPSSDEHGDGETKDGSKCDVEGDSTGGDDKTGNHGDGENTDDGDIVCDDEGESDKGSDDNKGDEDDLQCDDDEDSKDDGDDNKGGKDDDNKDDDDDDEQCGEDDKSDDDNDVSEHSKSDNDDDCDEDGDDSDDDDNSHGEKSDHDSDSDSEGDDKHTKDSHASGTKTSTSNKYTDINISTIYAITTANSASVSMSVSKSASSSSSTSAKPTTSSSSEENSSSSQTMDGKSESKSIGLGPLIAIIFLAFGIVGLVSWGGLYYATRRKTEFNSSRAEVHQRSLANHDSSHDSGISTLNLSYSGPPVNNNAAQASTNPPRRDNHMSDLMQ